MSTTSCQSRRSPRKPVRDCPGTSRGWPGRGGVTGSSARRRFPKRRPRRHRPSHPCSASSSPEPRPLPRERQLRARAHGRRRQENRDRDSPGKRPRWISPPPRRRQQENRTPRREERKPETPDSLACPMGPRTGLRHQFVTSGGNTGGRHRVTHIVPPPQGTRQVIITPDAGNHDVDVRLRGGPRARSLGLWYTRRDICGRGVPCHRRTGFRLGGRDRPRPRPPRGRQADGLGYIPAGAAPDQCGSLAR